MGLQRTFHNIDCLITYAIGVQNLNDFTAAFFQRSLIAADTGFRSGFTLNIRQNHNLAALANLFGNILSAQICSIFVCRADKRLSTLEIGIDRQNRDGCLTEHDLRHTGVQRCNGNRLLGARS